MNMIHAWLIPLRVCRLGPRILLEPGVLKGCVVAKLVARENLSAEEGERLSRYLERCIPQCADLKILDLSSNGLDGPYAERIKQVWERHGGMVQSNAKGRLTLSRL